MGALQAHLCLDDSLSIRAALLPGDPARIDRIKPFLQNARELACNREFRSVAGEYKGVPVLAVSTGIGGASAGIAVEELHNIGVDTMIRIGSCGSLQPQVKLGDLILVSGAVRDDGASKTYIDAVYPAVPDFALLTSCVNAAKARGYAYHVGVARSHDSFYTDGQEAISAYWAARGVLGCDMESAALFVIGALRGVRTAAILNNVVECGQDTAQSIGDYAGGENLAMRGEENEILTALDALAESCG
ncbi:MAG: nucleoside phosphorylase [Clostridia bacterium]|nr:nucleoside phosphorylase [Clostridia bacterium]